MIELFQKHSFTLQYNVWLLLDFILMATAQQIAPLLLLSKMLFHLQLFMGSLFTLPSMT